MAQWTKLLKMVLIYTQLGFTLVTPPVVLLLLGWWLQSRLGLGTWVMVLCLAIGLVTAGTSAVQFFRNITKQSEKSEKKQNNTVNFHRHD